MTGATGGAECAVCRSSAVVRRRIGVRDVSVCRRCGFGLVVAGERPPDYWTRTENADDELGDRYWQARLPVFLRALDEVAAAGGTGRLVDVGGGTAHFAEAALAAGWDAYSYDVSERAVAAAAARVGPERSLAAVPDSMAGTCDVVTLWCVVAHVPDARAVLGEARRLLKPGGRLLLSTPNFSFQTAYAALAGRLGRPIDFVAHDHFAHYTPRSLEILLTSAGFSCSPAYWGVTEDCVLERGLAPVLVPLKRAWNRAAWTLSRTGVPRYTSELHVEAVPSGPRP